MTPAAKTIRLRIRSKGYENKKGAILHPKILMRENSRKKEKPMPIKRTTHRSSKGTKLYAVRDSKGRFKDIQTYERAHALDIKRGSKSEAKARAKIAK